MAIQDTKVFGQSSSLRIQTSTRGHLAHTSVRFLCFPPLFCLIHVRDFLARLFRVGLGTCTDALANHGIINRSGRGISMKEFRPAICKSLNTSYTLARNTTNGVEKLFGKNVIDLGCVAFLTILPGIYWRAVQ